MPLADISLSTLWVSLEKPQAPKYKETPLCFGVCKNQLATEHKIHMKYMNAWKKVENAIFLWDNFIISCTNVN